MIERYSLDEMRSVWSDENRYQKWLDVEIAVCEAWSYYGYIPKSSARNIKKKAKFSVKRINSIEKMVKINSQNSIYIVSDFLLNEAVA